VEFDNHMLRTDATPGTQHKIEVRREYISLTVDAYRLAERKAHAILADEVVRIAQEKLWILMRRSTKCWNGKILKKLPRLDDQETLYEKIQIGYLDLLVNQKMLGDR